MAYNVDIETTRFFISYMRESFKLLEFLLYSYVPNVHINSSGSSGNSIVMTMTTTTTTKMVCFIR